MEQRVAVLPLPADLVLNAAERRNYERRNFRNVTFRQPNGTSAQAWCEGRILNHEVSAQAAAGTARRAVVPAAQEQPGRHRHSQALISR
jgi:hypothetical protein